MDKAVNILVVDNERVWFDLLQLEALHHKANLSLTWVPDGKQALERLTQGETYDLIVMKPDLPDMDGMTTTRQIRTMGIDTPVVAWSLHNGASTKAACVSAGMQGLVHKQTTFFLDEMLSWCQPDKRPSDTTTS